MLINDIRPNPGTVKNTKRRGKGSGSGNGKTAGRGQTGDGSRSGHKSRIFFEGGQIPLNRRFPKRGFKNFDFKVVYQPVNISKLNVFENDAVVDVMELYAKGLISNFKYPVKLLGDGELSKKLTVYVDAFSASAKEKIENAGGKIVDSDSSKEEVNNSAE